MEVEERIVLDIRNGDENAFSQLFKDYYQSLIRYAFTFLNDSKEAEDIVQNVYIKLWENKEQEIHTSIKAFLYKMVYNASLNRVAQLKVRQDYVTDVQHSNKNAGVEASIYKNELEQKINEAIEKLPEQCKRIFKMSRFEEKKYQEIANELSLSIKTIENQMGKALKVLREELKDYLPLLLIILNQIANGN